MNRKALYGILLAILLPVICYFILKKTSEAALIMPRHYLPDSVITKTKSGKQYTDTVWHQLPDFTFTNQLGNKVSWKDMQGKIVVADFFFTHCPSICPKMTAALKEVNDYFKENFLQIVSFTVDPERDSSAKLKKYWSQFMIR